MSPAELRAWSPKIRNSDVEMFSELRRHRPGLIAVSCPEYLGAIKLFRLSSYTDIKKVINEIQTDECDSAGLGYD